MKHKGFMYMGISIGVILSKLPLQHPRSRIISRLYMKHKGFMYAQHPRSRIISRLYMKHKGFMYIGISMAKRYSAAGLWPAVATCHASS